MGTGIRIDGPTSASAATPTKKMKSNNVSIDGYSPRDWYTDNKGKGIIVHENPNTILNVGISFATEIDRETKDRWGDRRIYFVYGWVVEGGSFRTYNSGTLPNPEWYTQHYIYSGKFDSDLMLNLEVSRGFTQWGPGTSDGCASVGRCQVPLPKVFRHREKRQCSLVTPEGSAAGFLFIELELRKVL